MINNASPDNVALGEPAERDLEPFLVAEQLPAGGPTYADFTFRAEIDWIEVIVRLDAPTQPRHVRDRIAKALPGWGKPPYILPDTDDPSGTSSVIKFRVQSPGGPDRFMSEVQAVRPPGHRLLRESDIEVVAIEVALDARHRAQDRAALIAMCVHMVRHRARVPVETMVVTEKRRFRSLDSVRSLTEAFEEDCSVNSRHGSSLSYSARVYFKTYDSVAEQAYKTLPLHKHRARMEATLRLDELPFSTVEGWRAFRFEKLSPYFRMRVPTFSESTLSFMPVDRIMQFGTPRDERRVAGRRRLSKKYTKADRRWNELARVALRGLTQRSVRAGDAEIRTSSGAVTAPLSQEEGNRPAQAPEYLNTAPSQAPEPIDACLHPPRVEDSLQERAATNEGVASKGSQDHQAIPDRKVQLPICPGAGTASPSSFSSTSSSVPVPEPAKRLVDPTYQRLTAPIGNVHDHDQPLHGRSPSMGSGAGAAGGGVAARLAAEAVDGAAGGVTTAPEVQFDALMAKLLASVPDPVTLPEESLAADDPQLDVADQGLHPRH